MHGVKRSEFIAETSKDEEELKIESYKILIGKFSELYNENDKSTTIWADKMMECTKELVTKNPEYYTAWNERKRAIKLLTNVKNLIKSELIINVLAIKANPKSYGAWYHRRWFIENYCPGELKNILVEQELELLNQLLDLDCRNFHGWNYRIWLADWAELSIFTEFDFTTQKIYQNFSNYSAWHRRSHLLPRYLESNEKDVDGILRNEVEMCRNAAWTEPADQSIWFYQKWLFCQLPKLKPEHESLLNKLALDQIKSLNELIEEEKYGESVALAMSFIRFLLISRGEVDDYRIGEYLEKLRQVDPMRKGHWQ